MTMMTVIRDAEGKIINIGDWDYMAEPRAILAQGGEVIATTRKIDDTTGLPMVAEDGMPIMVEVVAEAGDTLGYDLDNPIVHNPLPEGATVSEAEVQMLPDGGLYVV